MLTGESIKSKAGSIAEKSIRKAGKKQDAYAFMVKNQISNEIETR
jgi:hypothetical protein